MSSKIWANTQSLQLSPYNTFQSNNLESKTRSNAKKQKTDKLLTSAIQSMTVAEVRKYLAETRKRWNAQTNKTPVYLTDILSDGDINHIMTIQDFALKFQQGHHQKRHNKGRKSVQSHDGNNDDGYYDEDNEEEDEYDDENDEDQTEVHMDSDTLMEPEENKKENKKDITTNNSKHESTLFDTLSSTPSPSSSQPKKTTKSTKTDTKSTTTNKKRGRPKKNDIIKERNSHSRSLMDFCK